MLSILEKIQYVLSGLVILAAIVLYANQGIDFKNTDDVKGLVRVPPKPLGAPKAPAPSAPPAAPAPAPAQTAADRNLVKRLVEEQNAPVAGKEVKHEDYKVPPDTVEYISREANWKPELDKAQSQLLAGADGRMTRLKVFNIDEDSLLVKFGIENNDVIELIDGERVDFEGTSNMDHIQRWKRLKEKIGKGAKIDITVTRGGTPVQISFQMGVNS